MAYSTALFEVAGTDHLLRAAKGTPPSCKPSRESPIAPIISRTCKAARFFLSLLLTITPRIPILGFRAKVALRETVNPLALSVNPLAVSKGWLHEGLGCIGRDAYFPRHPHQVRQGGRTHFSHELGTMDLGGGLAGSDFGRYLLVEPACHHQRQDLALARR